MTFHLSIVNPTWNVLRLRKHSAQDDSLLFERHRPITRPSIRRQRIVVTYGHHGHHRRRNRTRPPDDVATVARSGGGPSGHRAAGAGAGRARAAVRRRRAAPDTRTPAGSRDPGPRAACATTSAKCPWCIPAEISAGLPTAIARALASWPKSSQASARARLRSSASRVSRARSPLRARFARRPGRSRIRGPRRAAGRRAANRARGRVARGRRRQAGFPAVADR